MARSIEFVFELDLDTQLPHASMLAQPSIAFRLIFRTTSNAGCVLDGFEWSWSAKRVCKQVLRQLQGDAGVILGPAKSGVEQGLSNVFGDELLFMCGVKCVLCCPSSHGEKGLICGATFVVEECGNIIAVSNRYMECSTSFPESGIHVNEGSKSSPVPDERPLSTSNIVLLPDDGVVVADNAPGWLSSAEPDRTAQSVPKVKIGVFFPSAAIVMALESKKNADGSADSITTSGLTMLTLLSVVVLALLAFGLPALEDGLYLQSVPQVRQREHMGRALLHLTFAKKQPSQLARKRWMRGLANDFVEDIMVSKRLIDRNPAAKSKTIKLRLTPNDDSGLRAAQSRYAEIDVMIDGWASSCLAAAIWLSLPWLARIRSLTKDIDAGAQIALETLKLASCILIREIQLSFGTSAILLDSADIERLCT